MPTWIGLVALLASWIVKIDNLKTRQNDLLIIFV